MAYLKPDSVPARQEIEARKALAIVEKKTREMSAKQRKSYVIGPEPFDKAPELCPFFANRSFPRG